MNTRLFPAVAVAAATLAGIAACATINRGPAVAGRTTTPIKHVVVIFGENISFDHYFGTYPVATNPPGEPAFTAVPNTPDPNGLRGELLTNNPNARNPENGAGAANPFRLDRSQASTADQSHSYTPEQRAYHGGAVDLFPKYTGRAGAGGTGAFATSGLVMGYYDGNTVTALWNYAQRFAMSDNAHGDQYGPSTPGALNLASGQTNGIKAVSRGSRHLGHPRRTGFVHRHRRPRSRRRRLLDDQRQRRVGDDRPQHRRSPR